MLSNQLSTKMFSENLSLDIKMKMLEKSIARKNEEETLLMEEIALNSSSLAAVKKQIATLEDQNLYLTKNIEKIRNNCATSDQLQMEVVRNLKALTISSEEGIKKCKQDVKQYYEVISRHEAQIVQRTSLGKRKKKAQVLVEKKRILIAKLRHQKQELNNNMSKLREISKKRQIIEAIRLSQSMVEWKRIDSRREIEKKLLRSAKDNLETLKAEKQNILEIIEEKTRNMVQDIVNRSRGNSTGKGAFPEPNPREEETNLAADFSLSERLNIKNRQVNSKANFIALKQIEIEPPLSTSQLIKSISSLATEETQASVKINTVARSANAKSHSEKRVEVDETMAILSGSTKLPGPKDGTPSPTAFTNFSPASTISEQPEETNSVPAQRARIEPSQPPVIPQLYGNSPRRSPVSQIQTPPLKSKRSIDEASCGRKDEGGADSQVEAKKAKLSTEPSETPTAPQKEKIVKKNILENALPKPNKRVSFRVAEEESKDKGHDDVSSPKLACIKANVSASLPLDSSPVSNQPENSPEPNVSEASKNEEPAAVPKCQPTSTRNGSPVETGSDNNTTSISSSPLPSVATVPAGNFESIFGAIFDTPRAGQSSVFPFNAQHDAAEQGGASKPSPQTGQDFFSFFGTPTPSGDKKQAAYSDSFFKLF